MAEISRPIEQPKHYESSDISVRPLIVFGISALILAILIHLLLYGLFVRFENIESRADIPRSAIPSAQLNPPEPRLQGIPQYHENLPGRDMAAMREAETKILTSYGKTNEKGFVRIPIERAMQLVIEKGLPEEKGGNDGAK
jgi:hypothetical protein